MQSVRDLSRPRGPSPRPPAAGAEDGRALRAARARGGIGPTSLIRSAALALAALAAAELPEARALDLQGALREVASANPTLASRRDMVEAARRRVGPAGAWQSPMVEFGVVNVPTSGRFDMDPMTMKMVGLEQRVPIFGANRLSRRSAASAAAAEGAGLEMASYELFAMAWEAYSGAYYAGRLGALGLAHRAEMDDLVRSARARFESGNGRLDDVLRAQAEQARVLSDVAEFAAEEQSARARLAALMGRDAAALADSLEPPPPAPPAGDVTSLLAQLDESHPRLRELRAQVDRYRLAARAARRMLWPDLQLNVSYGIRQPVLGVPQDNMWSATVGFMLPVFAGQRELSEGAEMDAMARASESDLRVATLDLSQQVRSLDATLRSDQRMVSLLADTVVVTERSAVEASWSAYNAGATDLWRVLEAAHARYGEEAALVRARQELARTEARLLATTARADLFGLTLPVIGRSER
jgi:outer membrane protein TolC